MLGTLGVKSSQGGASPFSDSKASLMEATRRLIMSISMASWASGLIFLSMLPATGGQVYEILDYAVYLYFMTI